MSANTNAEINEEFNKMKDMAFQYFDQNNNRKALAIYMEILSLYKIRIESEKAKSIGQDNKIGLCNAIADMAETCNSIAQCYTGLENYELTLSYALKGCEYYQLIADMSMPLSMVESATYSTCMRSVTLAYYKLGNYSTAVEFAKGCLKDCNNMLNVSDEIKKSVSSDDYWFWLSAYEGGKALSHTILVNSLEALNRLDECKQVMNEAIAFLQTSQTIPQETIKETIAGFNQRLSKKKSSNGCLIAIIVIAAVIIIPIVGAVVLSGILELTSPPPKSQAKNTQSTETQKNDDFKAESSLEQFNPFDYVTFTYSGTAPYGEARINVGNDLPTSSVDFSVDKTNHLCNGDIIKVTANCYSNKFEATQTEMEYTVEGLPSYAMTLDEIPADALEKMNLTLQDYYTAYFVKTDSKSKLISMEYLGNYFIYPKNPSSNYYCQNKVYCVYKITGEFGKAGVQEYYWCGYLQNIIILPDGTASLDYQAEKGTVDWLLFDEYYFYGTEDLDKLFNKNVTANIDEYTYETTVGTATGGDDNSSSEATAVNIDETTIERDDSIDENSDNE